MYPNVSVFGATPALRRGVLQLTHAVLQSQRAPLGVFLDITFVNSTEMHRLNARTRGIDAPTDVLTFSHSSKEEAFVNELLFAPLTEGDSDPTDNILSRGDVVKREELLSLGDVYVSIDYMWQRCQRRPRQNLPLVPYLAAALVHAELHALGYDHTTPEELREMVKCEQRIGWRLHQQARRYPWSLQPLDPFEYLRAKH